MGKDSDFDSLFNDDAPSKDSGAGFDDLFGGPPAPEQKKTGTETFDFDSDFEVDKPRPEKKLTPPQRVSEDTRDSAGRVERQRCSNDFKPDMDALLITAQSSMIIEGTKRLSETDYSSKTMQVYAEAIKGVDLYIKIIQRNPNSYRKLTGIIRADIDCAEVERIAFSIYKSKHHGLPEDDAERLKAYEYFRERLKNGYKKALIANSISQIKQYFLLSGGLDTEKVSGLLTRNDPAFKNDIAKLNQNIQIAIELIEKGEGEIQRGLRGRDTNTYIIKTSQLLYYYYNTVGETQTAEYYKRQYINFKKYNIIKQSGLCLTVLK